MSPASAPEDEGLAVCGRFRYEAADLQPRQALRLAEIAPFFEEAANLEVLTRVATQSYDVSLRALDFCCTNYAKKTRVLLACRLDGLRGAVQLFSLYKDWLRHYRRRGFDPFRRRERVLFERPQEPGVFLETTVAQLNFLRWAIVYGIVDYVRRHLPAIEKDMNATLTRAKRLRGEAAEEAPPAKRGRAELSKAPRSKCAVYEVKQNLAF